MPERIEDLLKLYRAEVENVTESKVKKVILYGSCSSLKSYVTSHIFFSSGLTPALSVSTRIITSISESGRKSPRAYEPYKITFFTFDNEE